MQSRSFIWIGVFIGSTIGSLIPGLWGDGVFSYSNACPISGLALLGANPVRLRSPSGSLG
jgi:hypothetical protein